MAALGRPIVEPDEHAMIDAFSAIEGDDRAGQTQDLFVPVYKHGQFSGSWKRIEQELVGLLGPKWRPPAPAAKGAGA